MHRADGGGLALAGLYEIWRDPASDPDDPAGLVWSATVLTTAAEDGARRGARPDAAVAAAGPLGRLARPRPHRALGRCSPRPPAGQVARHPVDRAVGRVATNGPATCAPLDQVGPDAAAVVEQQPLTLFP